MPLISTGSIWGPSHQLKTKDLVVVVGPSQPQQLPNPTLSSKAKAILLWVCLNSSLFPVHKDLTAAEDGQSMRQR
jgi:hypothetical protein